MSSLFINGQWQEGAGAALSKTNPADNSPLWRGRAADAAQVDAAVAAGRAAFKHWARTPLDARVAVAKRFGELLSANKDALARVIAQETGKPLWEAQTEVTTMVNKVDISLKSYHERTGERAAAMGDAQAVLRHKPHGVVAVFGPYNFPGHLPNGHIVPALLAGNAVIFAVRTDAVDGAGNRALVGRSRPAGRRDRAAARRARHRRGAGRPRRHRRPVLHRQLRHRRAAAQELRRPPGQDPGAGNGRQQSADRGRVQDIDAAVHHIVQSAFVSAGQRCTCARRLLVPQGAWGDALLARLVEVTAKLRVGKYDAEPAPFMGAVISSAAAEALLQAQAAMLAAGGKALLEMRRLTPDAALLSPGIIDTTAARPDEEYFGPLLQVIRYADFDQAIAIANDTRFGRPAACCPTSARCTNAICWKAAPAW